MASKAFSRPVPLDGTKGVSGPPADPLPRMTPPQLPLPRACLHADVFVLPDLSKPAQKQTGLRNCTSSNDGLLHTPTALAHRTHV